MRNKVDGTFRNNLKIRMHRWYPYVEGYSEGFVKAILDENKEVELVYDPFNGSGTTTLTCAFNDVKSVGTEINPLMRFISKTKVNAPINIIQGNKLYLLQSEIEKLEYIDNHDVNNINVNDFINNCYIDSNYFSEESLEEIAFIKSKIKLVEDEDIRDLMNLALASIVVSCSKMIRATDLRRRKEKELKMIKNPMNEFKIKLAQIYSDIDTEKENIMNMEYIEIIGNNAKKTNKKYDNSIDLVITSPPYVNGTNYFRNTKLELWILDFISKESDLKKFRGEAVTAGINNVSTRLDEVVELDFINETLEKFQEVEKNRKIDNRIPKMIEAYFSDMFVVFDNLNKMLKINSKIYFDIGDSQYYGVYIPVFEYIIKIAEKNNFCLLEVRKVRDRRSNSGYLLSQNILIFEKKQENHYE